MWITPLWGGKNCPGATSTLVRRSAIDDRPQVISTLTHGVHKQWSQAIGPRISPPWNTPAPRRRLPRCRGTAGSPDDPENLIAHFDPQYKMLYENVDKQRIGRKEITTDRDVDTAHHGMSSQHGASSQRGSSSRHRSPSRACRPGIKDARPTVNRRRARAARRQLASSTLAPAAEPRATR